MRSDVSRLLKFPSSKIVNMLTWCLARNDVVCTVGIVSTELLIALVVWLCDVSNVSKTLSCHCYLVDSASSYMLVPKIKPCKSKYKLSYCKTAESSLKQL